MKKVLSFVLVLSMILGSFGMAFAAPADVVGSDYEDAVNVLTELGVVAGYKDGTYRPENVVTRAEMATFIVKAMGLADYAVGKSEFSDMAGHWADPFVAYAVSLGFVKGNTDGTFAPDTTVTYDQAITMLVQAVGYKAEYMTGGYPGAFVNQAKTLGMLDGVKSGAAGANRGDVATLLFNTLDEAFVRYSTDGVLQTIIAGYEGDVAIPDTMMGRLGATAYAADNADEDGYFVVLGTEPSVIDLKEYQGALVKAYQNSDEKIVAMKEVKSVFLTGDLDMTELTFTVADGTEYKMDRVSAEAIEYFENATHNSTTDAVTLGDADGVVIAAKLSGKYVDEIYSIAVWDAEDTVMWDDDYAEILAEDFEIDGKAFATTDNDEIDTDEFVLVGAESLDKIPEDAIVTYYMGEVEEEPAIVKVEVSTTVVEGKITKVKDDKFTINGKAYKVAADAIDGGNTDSLDVNDEGKFYLDAAGKIAYFDSTTKVEDYAIVTYDMKTVDGAYSEDGVIKVKMMTADGKEAIYVVEDEDAAYTTGEAMTTAAISKGAVVAYKLNKDGEISKMVEQVTSNAVKLTAKGYLDGAKVSANVAVFEIESDGDIVKAELADVPVNADLGTSFKVVDATSGEVVVIVLAGEYGEDEEAVFAVLVDYGLVADPDDENAKVYEVEMLVDGVAKTYLTTSEAMAFTTDGALFELEFSGSQIAAFAPTTAAVGNGGNVTLYAVTADGNVQAEKNGEVYEVADDVVVYLYDTETDSVSLSSLKKISKGDTIKLYELDGDDDKDGHDVIIYTEN